MREVERYSIHLKLDASIAANGNFGRLLLIEVDEFSAWSLRDSTLVAQRRIRHPPAETKALNHFDSLVYPKRISNSLT